MKQETIKGITNQLNFNGEVKETQQSTRYLGEIETDNGIANFTVILPHSEMDDDYKVQFNGRQSQNLNRSHDLKTKVECAVTDAMRPVNLDDSADSGYRSTQPYRYSNTTTKKQVTKQQRKNRRKMAKKSRRANRGKK